MVLPRTLNINHWTGKNCFLAGTSYDVAIKKNDDNPWETYSLRRKMSDRNDSHLFWESLDLSEPLGRIKHFLIMRSTFGAL